MRALLVQTYTEAHQDPVYPLGLAYIGAALEEHEPEIYDLNMPYGSTEGLLRKIRDFSPGILGFSFRNIKVAIPGRHITCLEPYVDLLAAVRMRYPFLPIAAGGPAFSMYPELFMKMMPQIDIGVFGEAEETFRRIIDQEELGNIPGVYLQGHEGISYTGPPERPDFANLPEPRRDLCDIRSYLRYPGAIGVETKRGCAMRCIHCCDRSLLGSSIRKRPAEAVVDEIEKLATDYNVRHIFFSDQIFNVPIVHAKEICSGMIERGIKVKWNAWFHERAIDSELCSLAKRSGCLQLTFSPDSVDDGVLTKLNKSMRAQDIYRTVELARESGMPATYNFMLNCPGENLRSLWALARFILHARKKLGKRFVAHGLFMVPMRIYPHTELQRLAVEEGIIESDNDLLEPVFYNPKPMAYVTGAVLSLLNSVWRVKQWTKPLIPGAK